MSAAPAAPPPPDNRPDLWAIYYRMLARRVAAGPPRALVTIAAALLGAAIGLAAGLLLRWLGYGPHW